MNITALDIIRLTQKYGYDAILNSKKYMKMENPWILASDKQPDTLKDVWVTDGEIIYSAWYATKAKEWRGCKTDIVYWMLKTGSSESKVRATEALKYLPKKEDAPPPEKSCSTCNWQNKASYCFNNSTCSDYDNWKPKEKPLTPPPKGCYNCVYKFENSGFACFDLIGTCSIDFDKHHELPKDFPYPGSPEWCINCLHGGNGAVCLKCNRGDKKIVINTPLTASENTTGNLPVKLSGVSYDTWKVSLDDELMISGVDPIHGYSGIYPMTVEETNPDDAPVKIRVQREVKILLTKFD